MLRLVRNDPPKPRRKGTHAGSALTAEQQSRVKAALRRLRSLYGGWGPLSEALGIVKHSANHLVSPRHVISGDTLIRVCKAGGLSVDALLNERVTDAGRCRACGAKRVTS